MLSVQSAFSPPALTAANASMSSRAAALIVRTALRCCGLKDMHLTPRCNPCSPKQEALLIQWAVQILLPQLGQGLPQLRTSWAKLRSPTQKVLLLC